MTKRHVFILWLVAIALGGGIAYLKQNQKSATAENTARVPGDTLFAEFPATAVAAVEIKGGAAPLNLVKKDNTWTVAERDGFPAGASSVNTLLRTLAELKVTQGIKAGPSFMPRFGLDESASSLEKRGYTLTFKDKDGKNLATVSIDQRKTDNENPANPMGGMTTSRFVRNHADTSGVYKTSEAFQMVSDDPKRWMDTEFIKVERPKAITVSAKDAATPAWKLVRDTEEGPFSLEGATAAEVVDTTVTDPLKTIFSYSRIEDVIPASKVAEKVQDTGKRTIAIETFDGITYTVNLTPLKAPADPPAALADPNNPPPPTSENFAATVEIKGEPPAERVKPKDEKPEDAKTADAAFADRKKALTERLAKDKALVGRVFELPKYAVEALLKERSDLIKKDAPAATPSTTPGETPGATSSFTPPVAVPPAPGKQAGKVEAFTEPIAVGSTPEDAKDKPADSSDKSDKSDPVPAPEPAPAPAPAPPPASAPESAPAPTRDEAPTAPPAQ